MVYDRFLIVLFLPHFFYRTDDLNFLHLEKENKDLVTAVFTE